MGKSSPSRQHFIPRSYLKNFGRKVPPKKCFVDILELGTSEIKPEISIRDICISTNLYTLPFEGVKKYSLETYYSTHVDDIYPEVYELLIDQSKTVISGHQRKKILNTLLSLYFRAPKALNAVNRVLDEAIDKAVRISDPDKETITVSIEGRKYVTNREGIEDIKRKEHEISRRGFLLSHLHLWKEYVEYKTDCGIMVYELEGENDLITSDHPVIISGTGDSRFHLFNPTNMIQIPLDRRHYVMIAPNTEQVIKNHIFRSYGDDIFTLSTNHMIQKNADRQLFGFSGTLISHITIQAKYSVESDEGNKIVDDIKAKVEYMKGLYNILETAGPRSPQVALEIERLLALPLFYENKELLNLKKYLGID